MYVCLSRYYPYHYAPFLSDIRNISGLKLTFDLGKPFMPFQQLLAVLPAASMELLPEAYRVTHSYPSTHTYHMYVQYMHTLNLWVSLGTTVTNLSTCGTIFKKQQK